METRYSTRQKRKAKDDPPAKPEKKGTQPKKQKVTKSTSKRSKAKKVPSPSVTPDTLNKVQSQGENNSKEEVTTENKSILEQPTQSEPPSITSNPSLFARFLGGLFNLFNWTTSDTSKDATPEGQNDQTSIPATKENKTTTTLDFKEIKIIKSLSSGSFGDVFLGEYKSNKVAVKVFKNKNLDAKAIGMFQKEVSLLSRIAHPNVGK